MKVDRDRIGVDGVEERHLLIECREETCRCGCGTRIEYHAERRRSSGGRMPKEDGDSSNDHERRANTTAQAHVHLRGWNAVREKPCSKSDAAATIGLVPVTITFAPRHLLLAFFVARPARRASCRLRT